MSDEFNPFKDIFSEKNKAKFESDSINFLSTVIRQNEKNVERFKEVFSKKDFETPMPIKGDKIYYECPFPTPDNPLTIDDICPFPNAGSSITRTNEREVDLLKSPESTNPNGSDGLSKPLTDREVTDKTSSMWRYKPVLSTVEPSPEYVTEKGYSDYAEVLASSVRGKKHKHDGSNCDDNFSFDFVGDCCIVAVSDGAGSKKFSRLGSKEVTSQYVKYIKGSMGTLLRDSSFLEGIGSPVTDSLFNTSCSKLAIEMQNAVKSSYGTLVSKFEDISKKWDYIKEVERDITISDLSCTLLTAIIIPVDTPNGVETFTATLQVGDGLICSINASNSFDTCTKVLGSSDRGDFSGETEFITSPNVIEPSNILRRIKISKSKTSVVVLATDGVADDYFPYEVKSAKLYMDLQLNSILPIDYKDSNSVKIVPPFREQKTIEEAPRDVCVAYSEDIQEFFNIDDRTLWKDKSFIGNAMSVYKQSFDKDRSINLQSWLDNYTKRGSFDDRTLFIYRTIK